MKKVKYSFLIIARQKSQRLPNKLFKKIFNKTIIEHMIDRLKNGLSNKIILCTSNLKSDSNLVKVAKAKKIKFFAGDPDDVIKRMYMASKKYGLSHFLVITADCPLVEASYAKKILNYQKKNPNIDLIRAFDLPHGAFCYGIRVNALKKVIEIKATKKTSNCERYFTDTGIFKIHDFKVKKTHKHKSLRLTLDYYEDLQFLKKIFEKLYVKKNFFILSDIIKLVKNDKKLLNINKHLKKNYIKKYKLETKLKLKSNFKIDPKRKKYKKFVEFIK